MTTHLLACCLAVVTAYSPTDPGVDHVTATGATVQEGVTVAADPRHWPFGTRVWIQGLGWRTVEDTGGAITGRDRFDVYFDTDGEAVAWGRKVVRYRLATEDNDPGWPEPGPTATKRHGTVPVLTVECEPGISAQETPTTTVTITDTPTELSTDEPTPTPQPTATPTYTASPTASDTPSSTPTATPTPTWTPVVIIVTTTPGDTATPAPTWTAWVVTGTPQPTATARPRWKVWLPITAKRWQRARPRVYLPRVSKRSVR